MYTKKLLLFTCLIAVFAISANAQFHIEIGLTGNSPQGDFGDTYNVGLGTLIEPKYAISENIDLGLLIGRFGFVGDDVEATTIGNTITLEVENLSMTSIMPTGTYRFTENKVTPYVGAGIGMYFYGSDDVDNESKFGFAPRAGVYIGRLNLGFAYNVVKDLNFIQFNLGIRILSRD